MQNFKRNDTNEITYKKEKRLTDLENKLRVARVRMGGKDG